MGVSGAERMEEDDDQAPCCAFTELTYMSLMTHSLCPCAPADRMLNSFPFPLLLIALSAFW